MNHSHHTILKKSLISLIGTALLASAGHAKSKEEDGQRNPLGCRDSGYEYVLKVLKLYPGQAEEADKDRQSLYFVFNRHHRPIHLYQMQNDNSANSLSLNHVIYGQQWAVLATGEKELKYICALDDGKTNYGKVVDCADSIKVCEFARVRFGVNNRGNYWIVQSNTRGGAVQEVVRYGIIPQ